jgi:hypothetical protein
MGKNGAGHRTTKNQPISHRFRPKYEYQRAEQSRFFIIRLNRLSDHKSSETATKVPTKPYRKAVKPWDAKHEAFMDYEMQRIESISSLIASCS